MSSSLEQQQCESMPKGSKPLIIPTIESNLSMLSGWESPLNYANIHKTYAFKNYHQTISFVNAVTWIANKEDHHPTICFDYNSVTVTLTTHNAKGLTQNDFIMAAKIDALLA